MGINNLKEPYAAYVASLRRTKAMTEAVLGWWMVHGKNSSDYEDTFRRWAESDTGD